MNFIPSGDVSFHPHSFGDQQIRLFRWQGRTYRGISQEYAPFFKQLFQNKIIHNAVEKGLLIDSELTAFAVDRYELVVHHRTIPFASYPTEWCPAMLKDGALTLIDLALELARDGYTLGDAHPWNLLFDIESGKPIFVDLGSIVPITAFTWASYDEFCKFCLYPLILMSKGHDRLARLLMWEDSGVLESDLRQLSGVSISFLLTRYRSLLSRAESKFALRVPESYRHWLRRACDVAPIIPFDNSVVSDSSYNKSLGSRVKCHARFLESVRRDIERVRVWSDRKHDKEGSEGEDLSATPQEHWTATQCLLHKLLTELQPRTILDVGSDSGWYAKLATLLRIQVVRWDAEPGRVAQFYKEAKESKLPLLPLVMDFSKPTPARGLANHWSISAMDRFRCEMVVALGVLHRIVGERRLNFDQIIDGLDSLASRWVLVEFSVGEHAEPREQLAPRPWYTLDNFVRAARTRFREVRLVSQGENGQLLLCEK